MYPDDDTTYSALLGCCEFNSVCVLNRLARSIGVQVTETEILTQRILVQDCGTQNYTSTKTKKQSHS
jgi:hypothetical protein